MSLLLKLIMCYFRGGTGDQYTTVHNISKILLFSSLLLTLLIILFINISGYIAMIINNGYNNN